MSSEHKYSHKEGDTVFFIKEYYDSPQPFKIITVDQRYLVDTLCDYHLFNPKFGSFCVRSDQEEITLFSNKENAAKALKKHKLQQAIKKIKALQELNEKFVTARLKLFDDISKMSISDDDNLFETIENYISSPSDELLDTITTKIKNQA